MNEKEFISNKIEKLIKEGKSKQVASAIAYSMWKQEQKHVMQQAGQGQFNIQNQLMPPQQDFSVQNQNYLLNAFTPAQETPQTFGNQNVPQPTWYDQNSTFFQTNQPAYTQQTQEEVKKQENANVNTQIYNPFGGVSLEQSLFTLGQGLGEKDANKTILGAGLSGLKLARIGLSGYGTGKQNRQTQDEFYKNLYKDNRPIQMLQQGAEVNQAEALTGKFIVDQGQGNVELENNELVKDNKTGNIQKVVGDKHVDGGVTTTLEDSKILSDYTKIGAKNAKELKDRYQISLKSSDTFAKAMDKVNKKIGVEKATEELAETIKKVGKNESVKSKPTQKLNEEYLTKEVEEYQTELDELSGVQNVIFEDLFERQEEIPKKGKQGEILDKNGKVVQTRNEPISQQGGINMQGYDTYEEELKSRAPQKPVKRILYNVGTNEVKEGSLPPGQYTKVEYLDNSIDYLDDVGYENFKRMNNFRIYQEQQTKPKENLMASMQEGGVFELANKYGISPERAQELISMQMGGEPQQQVSQEEVQEGQTSNSQNGVPQEQGEISQEQVIQVVVQMLQQGISPEEVVQQLTDTLYEGMKNLSEEETVVELKKLGLFK